MSEKDMLLKGINMRTVYSTEELNALKNSGLNFLVEHNKITEEDKSEIIELINSILEE